MQELPRGTQDQEALCHRLWEPVPVDALEPTPEDFPKFLAEQLGVKLMFTGHGPTAAQKNVHPI